MYELGRWMIDSRSTLDLPDAGGDTTANLTLCPEERTELDRRLAEYRADPPSAIPWERVRDALTKRKL